MNIARTYRLLATVVSSIASLICLTIAIAAFAVERSQADCDIGSYPSLSDGGCPSVCLPRENQQCLMNGDPIYDCMFVDFIHCESRPSFSRTFLFDECPLFTTELVSECI
jgi:hypothetical protein